MARIVESAAQRLAILQKIDPMTAERQACG
jgi:hypothetical protein